MKYPFSDQWVLVEKWRLQASKRIESDTNVRTSKHEEIYEWKGVVELVAAQVVERKVKEQRIDETTRRNSEI